jgi:hypothetical protein
VDDTKKARKKGRADELEKNRLAVGALLYARAGEVWTYVGLAVPVVERESHVTRVAYAPGRDSHDSHDLIEVVAPRRDSTSGEPIKLPPSFVKAMFLDDVVRKEPTEKEAVDGFKACFRRLASSSSEMSLSDRILDEPKPSMQLVRNLVGSGSWPETPDACAERTLGELEKNASGEHMSTEETYVLPFGLRAILVHIEGQEALIAVAEENEKHRFVQFWITSAASAKCKLEVLVRARASPYEVLKKEEREYGPFLRALLGTTSKCKLLGVQNAKQPTEASDPHLSIRELTVAGNWLFSHAPRGVSVTFHNILLLLGLAIGLQNKHVAISKSETAVVINAAKLWGDLAWLDREIKKAAAPSVSSVPPAPSPLVDVGSDVAPLVAALYSRCAWLDASSLRPTRSDASGATKLTAVFDVRHSSNRMPPREDLDVGAFLGTLESASEWVRSPGVLALIEIEGARHALVVLLSLKARRLLVEETSVLEYEPKQDDHLRVVEIAHFLCYLSGKLEEYAQSLVRGMLARCARYAVSIARNSALNETQAEDLITYSVNPGAKFETCLPWAASEYCAFLKEARGVARLLFASSSPYMASLASAESAGTTLNQEDARFAVHTATHARAQELNKAWEHVVPTQQLFDRQKENVRAIVSKWIRNEAFLTDDSGAIEAAKGAIRETIIAEFGSCPGEFETMTIDAIAETLKDTKTAIGGGLTALRDAFIDETSKNGSALYDLALSALTKGLGDEEKAHRAMLGAAFRLRELDNRTHEERVAVLKQPHGDRLSTAVMRVQACVALALGRYPNPHYKRIVETCRTQALKPTQERALRYLCTDPRVAALNVTIWLLNVTRVQELESPKASTPYVIGNGTNGIALFQFQYGHLAVVSTVPLLARTGEVRPQHEDMLATTEGVYVASRARLAVTPDESASDDAPWLKIVVCETRPKLAHDIRELVKWAELEDAAYACKTGKQAVRAYTMPLSRKGPSEATLKKLADFARKCGSWKEGPYKALRDLLLDNRLVATERGERDGKVEREERVFAYVTVAVLRGRIEDLINRELETIEKAVFVSETPRVTWAPPATRARLSRLAEGRHALSRDGHEGDQTLVIAASGGAVGRLHGNLVRAGCTFDHWVDSKNKTSELVFPCGLVISGTDAGLALALGETEMPVFLGVSEYWDKTFGAAVVPVGTTRVEKLVVVPGTRGSPEAESVYVTVNSALQTTKMGEPKAAIEHFRRLDPFVVELDAALVLPAGSTTTEDLVALFVAYAYAGSMCGTRLIPLVASRVGGAADPDKILCALYGAPCPLSFYAVCAASYTALRACKEQLARKLGCAPEAAARELRAKMLWADEPAEFVDGLDAAERRVRQRALAPAIRYGDCERDFVRARLEERARDDAKARDLLAACKETYCHADPWMTALEASTGRFVRADQRARIAEILAERWAVVQMQMGFGKSSVIVPMLVARYLSRAECRVVLVTQPAHLVAAAFRAVGSLVAAQPSLDPVYVLGHEQMRAVRRDSWADAKLVVVLSTADLQRLVRDAPLLFYENSGAIAHVADEVDEESDPLKCEVIVEGAETKKHYDENVANNIGAYYRAALELGHGPREPGDNYGPEMNELVKIHPASAIRLEETWFNVRDLVHKVEFGPAEDPEVYVAVPYVCANKPSAVATFSDIDVAIGLLVISLAKGMRPSDVELVKRDIRAKFGHATGARIIERLDEESMSVYFATQIAMPRLRVSEKESSVSFVDLLGIAATFVGFSGTMGTSVRVPDYARDDPRAEYTKLARGGSVPVHSHDESNEAVRKVLAEAKQIDVQDSPSRRRAATVLGHIVDLVRTEWQASPKRMICVVDGSGEFGAFDDDLETVQRTFKEVLDATVGYFKAGKLVKPEARVRYYSHRDARGVDSEMDADTVGFVAIWASSRYSEVAQAVYRLRGIGKGQTAKLVVAREGKDEDFGLVDELTANEEDHVESAETVLVGQLAHARKRKENAESFEREVTMYKTDVAKIQARRTAEKQQTQTRQQVAVQVRKPNQNSHACFTARLEPAEYPTLANGARTGISKALGALRVSLSPFLTSSDYIEYGGSIQIRRRAFAVYDDDGPRLVVMALAEVWTRYRYEEKGLARQYVAYSHDGVVLRGDPNEIAAPPGMVLFGRYLCDDELSLLAEYQLLHYLRRAYGDKRAELHAVLSCLWESTFLLKTRVLLEAENVGKSMDNTAEKGEKNVVADIREKMFGGARALDSTIMPYVSQMYHAPSAAFGKRRFV